MTTQNTTFSKCQHGSWEKSCNFCWNKDQNTAQKLMDKGVCPECGGNKTNEYRSEGDWIFECEGCGFTASS